jgi:hypothetical protein
LVDGANGIYCWRVLTERLAVFKEDGAALTDEEVKGLQGEDFCEWLDWLGDLYVEDAGVRWLLYQDGDIFAVHPDAEWSDEEEWYVMPNLLRLVGEP